jgi:hypothetical protein
VEPGIVVGSVPHSTFQGKDAQPDGAIAHLEERLDAEPVERRTSRDTSPEAGTAWRPASTLRIIGDGGRGSAPVFGVRDERAASGAIGDVLASWSSRAA